jgi:integrase
MSSDVDKRSRKQSADETAPASQPLANGENASQEVFLDERETAAFLRVSPSTVRNERIRGKLGFTFIGARIFYTRTQIADYLRRQTVPPCANGPQSNDPDKLENTGSAKSLGERGTTMHGRTWFDERARQTRRLSLGTTDFQEASLLLANWVVANARPPKAAASEVLIDTILLNYWSDHAKDLPGAKTQWNGLSYWQEFWTGRTVAEITPQEQRAFRQWLVKRGMGEGGIDRVLSTGRAALNRAHKWQELSEVPHIFGTLTAEAKRARAPMGHPITPLELARLFDAARSRHMLIYLLIASNTLARPSAILDLRRSQFDQTHKLLDLNPAGRKQNKKFRPIVPVSATLAAWLRGDQEPEARYVAYRQKPIKSIKRMWHLTCEAAGLDDKLSPYSIRHGMARNAQAACTDRTDQFFPGPSAERL